MNKTLSWILITIVYIALIIFVSVQGTIFIAHTLHMGFWVYFWLVFKVNIVVCLVNFAIQVVYKIIEKIIEQI